MPTVHAVVSCEINESYKVDQVRGMFDLTAEKTASREFSVELPADDDDWSIGVIVGPSGSGKTTIAREAYGKKFVERHSWKKNVAVIDCFGDHDIKAVTGILTAVGFSSPPAWLKPYSVLSNGERFRCDLASSLINGKGLIAYDEFTSVVDRTVAKIGSAAVSKAIRKKRIDKKFVAVTCHYDILDWLEPDWVLDMASGQLARGRLRRPEIKLEITPVHYSAWVLFRQHHYLSRKICTSARCFGAFIDGEPVAFTSWITCFGRGSRKRQEHRTVVLPDYQGVGIGNRLSEYVASMWTGVGVKAFSTTSHPAMIRYRSQSGNWNRKRIGFALSERVAAMNRATNRITAGFEFVGKPMGREKATILRTTKPSAFTKLEQ